MLSLETLLTFVGAATLLAWVPGPDNLFVLTQSALSGRAVGIYVTLGLCAGLIVHTVAVSLGVAAIFQTSQTAFDALKIVGAIYLLYLSYKAFTSKPDEPEGIKGRAKPAWQMFARGVMMNVTNPKVAIFFLAFLPQFTAPERGSVVLQMLALGGVFIVCAFASFALISVLSGSLSSWLRRSSKSRLWLDRAAGVVFVGIAVKIATSNR
ncbi:MULTISPECIES: LysE family translocator [Sinorhizobium]|uniref:Threonine transporter RhtB n=2 Tax=Sinorhizobium TaxID=28105 RepID=A0A2S3YJA1_9HYPH|nr:MULTISPECIES: LysE family translocator [Sinorhizobium]AUX79576.1 LysE family amino acid efflux protein [Sinorhizobium fredii]PDT41230.1 threonine transporter RhtB [Sinorhizobium sp. FG01]POH27430.1 threonine transporter RhtB [Sinorhizobium americanum]